MDLGDLDCFLGFTIDEYNLFLTEGNDVIPDILSEYNCIFKNKLDNHDDFDISNILHGWLVLKICDVDFVVSYLSDDMYEQLEKIRDLKDGGCLYIVLDGEGYDLRLTFYVDSSLLKIIWDSDVKDSSHYGDCSIFIFEYKKFVNRLDYVLNKIKKDYEKHFRINEKDFE